MEEELPFNRRDLLNERPPVETGSGRGQPSVFTDRKKNLERSQTTIRTKHKLQEREDKR